MLTHTKSSNSVDREVGIQTLLDSRHLGKQHIPFEENRRKQQIENESVGAKTYLKRTSLH